MQLLWNQLCCEYPIDTGYIRKSKAFSVSLCHNNTSENNNNINLMIPKTPIYKASLQCNTNGCLQFFIMQSVPLTLSLEIVIFLGWNLKQIFSQTKALASLHTEYLLSSVLTIMRSKAYICECNCNCSKNGIYLAEFHLPWIEQHYLQSLISEWEKLPILTFIIFISRVKNSYTNHLLY